jgi:hypothetical protein
VSKKQCAAAWIPRPKNTASFFQVKKKISPCFFFHLNFSGGEGGHVFLKVECAGDKRIGYSKLHAHSGFKKMMQGT